MQINLETADKHAIQSYTDTEVKIDSKLYNTSLIVSRHEIMSPWPVCRIQELNESNLADILQFNPEIILLGHGQPGVLAPMDVHQALSKSRIGMECMSIGAACRTFNVLLNEQRDVVLILIFAAAG